MTWGGEGMKIGCLEPWQLQEGCGSEALGFSFCLKYPRVGAGKVSNQETPMKSGRSPKKSQKDREKGGSVSLARKETFGHNCSISAKQHRKSCSFTPTSISKRPAGKPHFHPHQLQQATRFLPGLCPKAAFSQKHQCRPHGEPSALIQGS